MSYTRWADDHPYINCVILAFIQSFVGDLVAQFIIEPKLTGKYEKWCWKRSARMIFQCIVMNSIIVQSWMFFCIPLIQNWINNFTSSNIINMIITISIDQLPYVTILNLYVLFTSDLLRFGDCKKALNFAKDNLWRVLCACWCIWPIAQIINYNLIPRQHRYIYDAFVNIIWQCFISYVTQNSIETENIKDEDDLCIEEEKPIIEDFEETLTTNATNYRISKKIVDSDAENCEVKYNHVPDVNLSSDNIVA